jgi:hypothetical protein
MLTPSSNLDTFQRSVQMPYPYNTDAMARDLRKNGLDEVQGRRYDLAFVATKIAAVAMLCARYGASEVDMLEALMDSSKLNAEVSPLVARMELSAAFVGHIHSGLPF